MAATAAPTPARRTRLMAQGHGTTHRPVKRGPPPGYTRLVARRDPHDVLGVAVGATPTEIKAAWRRLARSNHPDLTGDDPAASRAATRRMAEINEAYASLSREAERDAAGSRVDRAEFDGTGPRRGGPPRPRPSRPVTGRVDTTGSFRPRNQTTTARTRAGLNGQPPRRGQPVASEPPRASTPTGPL